MRISEWHDLAMIDANAAGSRIAQRTQRLPPISDSAHLEHI
jgi:hypothetical protein